MRAPLRPLWLLLALWSLNAITLLHAAEHPLTLDEASCEFCVSGVGSLPPLPAASAALPALPPVQLRLAALPQPAAPARPRRRWLPPSQAPPPPST